MFNKQTLKTLLKDHDEQKVDQFISYMVDLATSKKKDGKLKNPWMQYKKDEELALHFRNVEAEGLDFDGDQVILTSTGVHYTYVAYKNKMLLAYPESKVDAGIVREGDEFSYHKENGKVIYNHKVSNPFNKAAIQGAYCVIRNSRGDFMTVLNKKEIDKHRGIAKTDFIWKKWGDEMIMKTIIKKACKYHFQDIYTEIETVDNENYELEEVQEAVVSLEDRVAEALAKLKEVQTKEQLVSVVSDIDAETLNVQEVIDLGKKLKSQFSKPFQA